MHSRGSRVSLDQTRAARARSAPPLDLLPSRYGGADLARKYTSSSTGTGAVESLTRELEQIFAAEPDAAL